MKLAEDYEAISEECRGLARAFRTAIEKYSGSSTDNAEQWAEMHRRATLRAAFYARRAQAFRERARWDEAPPDATAARLLETAA